MCKICDVCAARKRPVKHYQGPMKKYVVESPLERIAINIMGPLPESEKENRYILVIADYFTKWTEAVSIRDEEAATVTSALIDRSISVFGVPREIHSDQGSNFKSWLFKEMCELLNIEKTRTTPFRPTSEGMVERANQTIQNMLKAFIDHMQRDWDMFLSFVMMAYRSSVHEATKVPSVYMMLGREITLPIDLVFGEVQYDGNNSNQNMLEQMRSVHDYARQNLKLAAYTMYHEKEI